MLIVFFVTLAPNLNEFIPPLTLTVWSPLPAVIVFAIGPFAPVPIILNVSSPAPDFIILLPPSITKASTSLPVVTLFIPPVIFTALLPALSVTVLLPAVISTTSLFLPPVILFVPTL